MKNMSKKLVVAASALAVANVVALECYKIDWSELCGGAYAATPSTFCVGRDCAGSIDNHCDPGPVNVNVNDCEDFGVNEYVCRNYTMQWDPIHNTCVGDRVYGPPEEDDIVLCHATSITPCDPG